MRKKNFFWMALTAAACTITLPSCSSNNEDEGNDSREVIVNMTADPQYINLTEAQRTFVNDNNTFSLNFLQCVNEKTSGGQGYIYSPLSITYVLGMVNDAATGNTEKEIEETLGFHQGGIKAVNEYCKKLIEGLPKTDSKNQLDIANAIFLNNKYELKQQFQEDMAYYYQAKAEALDFSDRGTLDHINGWCDEKTNGMIPSILDNVDPNVVSYLLNAIYFKADWTSKFDENNTRNETFYTESGGQTEVPMMHQKVYVQYMENDAYQAIRMPYGNGLWSMTIVLPLADKSISEAIDRLAGPDRIDMRDFTIPSGNRFKTYETDLSLPCYETSSDTDKLKGGLIGILSEMGIRQAFNSDFAEIPNMANRSVFIGMMRQKAKIKVNEKGSEAAAVTVIGTYATSAGPYTPVEIPKVEFKANRPFVYIISEMSTGVILFVGKFTGQ